MSAERMNVFINQSSSSRLTRDGNLTLNSASTTVKVAPRRSESQVLTLEHLEVLLIAARERGAPMNTPVQVTIGETYMAEPREIQARFLDGAKPDGE